MNVRTPRNYAALCALALAAALAACDAGPTAPAETGSLGPSASATSTLTEFPNFANFQAFSQCLNAPVTVYGPAWWSLRTVVKPDGSRLLTLIIDASGFTIISGGTVWTANPGASEIFVRSIPAGSTIDELTQHQGTIIFRSPDDGQPDLRLTHQIHLVQVAGTGEVQVGRNLFEIVCVGQ